MSAPSRDELRAHLVASRIAGDVATSRGSNVVNIGRMLDRDPHYTFGVTPAREWSYDEVVALLAERVGIDPNPQRRHGADRIDPDRTIERLERLAERLAKAAADRDTVLFATGHPTGLLPVHQTLARTMATHGCPVLRSGDGLSVTCEGERMEIRYVGEVATVRGGGDLRHTHSPEPMEAILARGKEPPGLVVADHGWAGAAGQAGITTVGFADCNDPALFVAEEEGLVEVVVPLDDNVLPSLYDPVTAYLVAHLESHLSQ